MSAPTINSQLQQADYILDACGRQQRPPNTSYVEIPSHIPYSRFMPGDGISPGTEDLGGIMHRGRVSFFLRAITAQSLPRNTQGVFWRLRFSDGRFFQSEMPSHSMAFGFGSDRQVICGGISSHPEGVEWKPGEKMFVDLDTIIADPPPSGGYTVVLMFEGVFRFPVTGPGEVSNPLGPDLPRYFQDPNQNILAPESAFAPGCPSETPAGYQDEEFCYVTPTRNLVCGAPGPPVSNVPLQIKRGSDFLMRAIFPYSPTATGFGSVVIRRRRGDGYVMESNFVPINSIQGPVFKELKIKAGDNFYWDGYIVDGGSTGTITFGLYLFGVKRRKVIA